EVPGGLGGRLESRGDPAQQLLVRREDHRLLGAVVTEERGAPHPGARGDVIDGRLVVAALVEELEGGLHEALRRRNRLLHHPGSCYLIVRRTELRVLGTKHSEEGPA